MSCNFYNLSFASLEFTGLLWFWSL